MNNFTRIAFNLVLMLLVLSISINTMRAEGTPQVMPNSTNGAAVLVANALSIGPYRGAPSENRIRFYINNFSVERLYFNVRAFNRTMPTPTQVQPHYRIVNAAGTQIVAPTQILTGQQIGTYAQAMAGPNIGGATPAGYTPFVFTPTANGEYYIELYVSADAGATATASQQTLLTLFDFTVATAANVKYPGRVYSQAWSIITYDPATNVGQINNSLEGDFFAYTTDSTINKVNFLNGFRPFGFTLYMNKYGAVNGGNWVNDRRSQNTGATAPSLPGGYPVFLNSPDAAVFARSAVAPAPTFGGKIYGCYPNYFIPFRTTMPGDIAILLDLNGVAGYQSGTADRFLFSYDAAAGNNVFPWDGLDGLGAIVSTSVTFNMRISLRRGRTNIPMFDAELNANGMSVSGIEPMAYSPLMYWNDVLLANTATATCDATAGTQNNNVTGTGIDNSITGVASPGRAWDGAGAGLAVPAPTGAGGSTTLTQNCDDYGNVRTLNTWYYSYEVESPTFSVALGSCSYDGDPVSDATDVDDDNDGILDITENGGFDPHADADSDGTPNYLDPTPGGAVPAFTDANGDGINDAFDTDLDGIINSYDLDSDNDGIADIVEAGGVDTDGDGRIDGAFADTDGDGLHNTYDASTGGDAIANLDTDGDGIPNTRDLDSDNDGIPDVVEAGGTDANNDGKIDGFTDTDNDGFAQSVDGDANNDGTAENTAAALIITGTDANSDGMPDSYSRANADASGLPNPYDLDADGDGILDTREAGIADSNNDGIADGTLGADGWSDTVDALPTLTLTNSDSDLKPNYLDIDADNDGITDNVEAQSTAGYIAPSGLDSDGDGIDNNYDNNDAAFAGLANNGLEPFNHDLADLPDYLDTDSDNDTNLDVKEGNDWNGNGLPDENTTLTGLDSDGDGLDNVFDLVNGPDVTVVGYGGTGSRATVQQTPTTATNKDFRSSLFSLPVTLISFAAAEKNGTAELNWVSEQEFNFLHYVVERSSNGTSFTAVATVNAKEGTRNSYQLFDDVRSFNASVVYYRLKLVDKDGRYNYSAIVRVQLAKLSIKTVAVTPNPVKEQVQVRISSDVNAAANIRVMNSAGLQIYQSAQSVVKGENVLPLHNLRSKLTAGIYIVQVIINGEMLTARFVAEQ